MNRKENLYICISETLTAEAEKNTNIICVFLFFLIFLPFNLCSFLLLASKRKKIANRFFTPEKEKTKTNWFVSINTKKKIKARFRWWIRSFFYFSFVCCQITLRLQFRCSWRRKERKSLSNFILWPFISSYLIYLFYYNMQRAHGSPHTIGTTFWTEFWDIIYSVAYKKLTVLFVCDCVWMWMWRIFLWGIENVAHEN